MNLQEAIFTLTDGDELRLMTRHNAADFVEAIAVVVGAARKYDNPDYKAFHKALYEWYHSERPMSADAEKELLDALRPPGPIRELSEILDDITEDE